MLELTGYALQTLLTPLGWFTQIFAKAEASGFFIGFFAAYTVSRILLRPFLGDRRKAGED